MGRHIGLSLYRHLPKRFFYMRQMAYRCGKDT